MSRRPGEGGRPGSRSAPVVAVVAGRSPTERYSLHRGYVDALAAVGAVPFVLPAGPGLAVEGALDLLASCDALVLSGGGDVHPATYGAGHPGATSGVTGGDEGEEGEEAVPEGYLETDAARDLAEIALFRAALAASIPVLGICRGAQLLAAAGGGALVADLPSAGHEGHWREDAQDAPVHGVEGETGSLAGRVLGGAREVNSIHHQAIADPGAALRATAWSSDGVIEAVEGPGVLGLQWHPERLAGRDARHLAPFSWLVRP